MQSYNNNAQPDDELCHYGVKGMKWGVHRARKYQTRGEIDKSMAIANKHAKKINKKVSNLDKKYARLDKKNEKAILKTTPKMAKLMRKSAKYEVKANRGLFKSDERREELRNKSAKLKAKAELIKNKNIQNRTKMVSNRHLRDLMTKGLSELDDIAIKNGKKLLGA